MLVCKPSAGLLEDTAIAATASTTSTPASSSRTSTWSAGRSTSLDLNTRAVAGFYDAVHEELVDVDGGDESVVLLFVGRRHTEATCQGGS